MPPANLNESGKLHEISVAIGRLEASVESGNMMRSEMREDIISRLDRMDAHMDNMQRDTNSFEHRVEAQIGQLRAEVDGIKSARKTSRRWLYGVAAVVAAVTTLIAQAVEIVVTWYHGR